MFKRICDLIACAWGNMLCLVLKALRCGSTYNSYLRIAPSAKITVDKGGRFEFGRGISIGARTICTVRENGIFKMGEMASLNADCKVVCHEKVEIGNNTIFGPNVLVYDHDHVFDTQTGVKRKEYISSEIVIGENCWIGAGTVILRGTHIGDNCVVGAGSVVKGDYPSGSKIVQKRGGY